MYNQYPNQQGNHARQGQRNMKKVERHMDYVPMSYCRFLPLFLMNSLVKLREVKAPPMPLPPDYDANARWKFHYRVNGRFRCVYYLKLKMFMISSMMDTCGLQKMQQKCKKLHNKKRERRIKRCYFISISV